jgi:hypothetical protein
MDRSNILCGNFSDLFNGVRFLPRDIVSQIGDLDKEIIVVDFVSFDKVSIGSLTFSSNLDGRIVVLQLINPSCRDLFN